ncbi:hypothetical protein LUZ60_011818 [Juncus effusus]|nr:hypothetical protein LUZ60_011818 [Juncus effusus]
MASCMGSAMASTSTLEVTVISAEDLRQGRRHLERGAFVTVRCGPSVASTVTDTGKSHGYPLWNESLYISAPPSAGLIQVEVGKRSNQVGSANVHIAAAKIPVSDFSYGPIGYKHFLSYRLRDNEGRANGIVNLCVRRLGSNGEEAYSVPAPVGYPAPVMAYPVPAGYGSYGKY